MAIVADTGGVLALLDRNDVHHETVKALFEESPRAWVLPWAILPEVDYLARTRLHPSVADAFVQDIEEGLYRVDGEIGRDLPRARALIERYASLSFGLVDAVVMAQAERHRAEIIVTTDGRHFRPVRLKVQPRLVPIDPR